MLRKPTEIVDNILENQGFNVNENLYRKKELQSNSYTEGIGTGVTVLLALQAMEYLTENPVTTYYLGKTAYFLTKNCKEIMLVLNAINSNADFESIKTALLDVHISSPEEIISVLRNVLDHIKTATESLDPADLGDLADIIGGSTEALSTVSDFAEGVATLGLSLALSYGVGKLANSINKNKKDELTQQKIFKLEICRLHRMLEKQLPPSVIAQQLKLVPSSQLKV